MKILSIVFAAILGIMSSSPSAAKSKDVGALFERTEPALGTMTLSEEGDGWRIALRVVGIPNGAATAADCELEAVGPQDRDGVISARVVPFEGELNSISAEDIRGDDPAIEVSVGPEGAFVTDNGTSTRYCGFGSDIDGFYRRVDTEY
jgi:hypothetical protein